MMPLERLQSSDALYRRVWGYLLERFPPVAYGLLVALFVSSAFLLAGKSPLEPTAAKAGLVVLLVFFHLRIMDEHKDGADDRLAYPDRLLSRGVVTLPLLARLGLAAIALECALAWWISIEALWAWLACLGFTLLMRIEFGVGRWLNRHLVIYAITHNPIVALLAAFLWVVAGGEWGTQAALYIGVVSLGSLAFEIGRKVRLPDEEIEGVDSYSSVLGKAGADRLLLGIRWVVSLGIGWMAIGLGADWVAAIAVLVSVALTVGLWGHGRGAKATEGAATVALLMDFILVGLLAW